MQALQEPRSELFGPYSSLREAHRAQTRGHRLGRLSPNSPCS
ncbi:mCG1035220 [Mus musculus]|nr:mCG1035220 [Mus musculus]